jgi:tRNA pseudouridine55 synthase
LKKHGVVVVDKPRGPTSHDVIARARRALHEKRIGHAGTLDPMASGVLVVLVGEATKLAPFLTANDKRYAARIALGVATDSLDAEGTVVATVPPSPALLAELAAVAAGGEAGPLLAAAVALETARPEQIPPAFSAIKVDGVRSYERARAGDDVELAPRPVEVRRLAIAGAGVEPPFLDVELEVSKGYYVRSLGRDLAEALGTLGHLIALRRTASGPFDLARASSLEDLASATIEPMGVAAARALGAARLDEGGVTRVRLGQRPPESCFVEPLDGDGPRAWLDADGALVAIGERVDGRCSILRGFAPEG